MHWPREHDIVNAADVSKGTVYAYFPSKNKLFAAMVFEDKRRHAERTAVLGTLKRRDPRLTAMQFVDLVQSGVTKPCLFGSESMADRIGYEILVDSAISLFLDGMKA